MVLGPTLIAQPQVDTDGLTEALEGSQAITGGDWLTAGLVLLGSCLVAWLGGRAIQRVLLRIDSRPGVMFFLRRLFRYTVVAIGGLYALNVLGVRMGPLVAALGVGGIILAFALQDILENFIAGILIQVRRPFRVGDEILSVEHEGIVLEINARTVVIETPDGDRAYLPAGSVIKNPMLNHTDLGQRRTTIDVGVAYASDLPLAKAVLVAAADSCAEVLDEPAAEALVTEFAESSILIALRFWHEPSIAGHWAARDAVAVAAKAALDDVGITIAFPQTVVTLNRPAAGLDRAD
jgi:small conductance mechanosensitive channel